MPLQMTSPSEGCGQLLCLKGDTHGRPDGDQEALVNYATTLQGVQAKIAFASVSGILVVTSAVATVYLLCVVQRRRKATVSALVVNSVLAMLLLTMLCTPLFYLENLSEMDIGPELCGVQRFCMYCSGLVAGLSVSLDLFVRMCCWGKEIRGKVLFVILPCLWILSSAAAFPSAFAKTVHIEFVTNISRHICVTDMDLFGPFYERYYNIGFVGVALLLPAFIVVLLTLTCTCRKLQKRQSKTFGLSAVTYAIIFLAGWTPYGSIWLYYWISPPSTELDMQAIFYTQPITFCFLLLINLWPLHFTCYGDRRRTLSLQHQHSNNNTKQLCVTPSAHLTPTVARHVNPPPSADDFVPSPIYTAPPASPPTPSSIPEGPPPKEPSKPHEETPEAKLRLSPVQLPLARTSRPSRSLKDKFRSKFMSPPASNQAKSGTKVATDLEYRQITSNTFSGRRAPPFLENWNKNQGSSAPVHTAMDDSGVIAEFFELQPDGPQEVRLRGGSERRSRPPRKVSGRPPSASDPFGVLNPSFDVSGEESNRGTAELPLSPRVSTTPTGATAMTFYNRMSQDDSGFESGTRPKGGRSRSSLLALRYNLSPAFYSSTHTDI